MDRQDDILIHRHWPPLQPLPPGIVLAIMMCVGLVILVGSLSLRLLFNAP